jgi:hypothetical protein
VETVSASILREKATKRDVKNIARAQPNVQVAIFKDTLVHLEKYLDTGDLRRLSPKSLGLIRDDILKIIDHLRELKPKLAVGIVGSADGILENLRDARDSLQVASGMFDASHELRETKSKQFFAALRLTREKIEAGLRLFKSIGGKE